MSFPLLPRRAFLKAAGSVVGAGLGAGLYAWRIEPHWIDVVERPLTLPGLPPGLAGRRLVHLSDLHIGPQVSESYLRHTFERVKAMAPDVVVYTGDFTSHSGDGLAQARRMFPHLPLGSRATLGILGNHDYGPNWAHPEIAERGAGLAGEAGVRILRNEVVDLGGLKVAGLDDLWAGRFDVAPVQDAALVLSHNPATVDLPGWDGFAGWILSGHTHGGQCKPPFLPPPLLPVKNQRYTRGAIDLGWRRQMYINRGLGHLIQVRFNVRPEITVFTLG